MPRVYATISAPHLEEPRQTFYVRFYHRAYRPDGVPLRFPGAERVVAVLAMTAHGALAIARTHYFLSGESFRLEEEATFTNQAGRDIQQASSAPAGCR